MMYPLVLDLAADRIPVAVACRVLGFSKQAFYKGELPQQGSDRRGRVDLAEHRAHAAAAQHIDIVDAVRAGAHPRDQRRQLRAGVRRPGADPRLGDRHLLPQQFTQPGLLGQTHHRHQTGQRHQTLIIEHR